MKRWITVVFMLFSTCSVAIEVTEFDNPEQSQRYKALIAELRCLVCQNQNLADSNAQLALDLKEIVQQKLIAGETDEQILEFMTQRYGDFVLYRPPFKSNTILLWLGPLLFLIFALLVAMMYIKKNTKRSTHPTEQQREQARNLLNK